MEGPRIRTLGEFVRDCPEDLVGKLFDWGLESTAEILNVWQEIGTRDVYAEIEDCDYGNMGFCSYSTANLSRMVGMHNRAELVEGVNAIKIDCIAYGGSVI